MIEMKSTNGYIFYISECDFEEVTKYKWFVRKLNNIYYVYNTVSNEALHHFLMKTPKGKVTDHKDGNGLNNTRKNLRICSVSENAVNTSRNCKGSNKFKGVSCDKKYGWQARLSWHGKRYQFRYYNTEEEACIVYNRKAVEIQGEFANLIPILDDGRIIKTKKELKQERKDSKNKYVYYVKDKKLWKAYLRGEFVKYFKNEKEAIEFVEKQLKGESN